MNRLSSPAYRPSVVSRIGEVPALARVGVALSLAALLSGCTAGNTSGSGRPQATAEAGSGDCQKGGEVELGRITLSRAEAERIAGGGELTPDEVKALEGSGDAQGPFDMVEVITDGSIPGSTWAGGKTQGALGRAVADQVPGGAGADVSIASGGVPGDPAGVEVVTSYAQSACL